MSINALDAFTTDLFEKLFTVKNDGAPSEEERKAMAELFRQAEAEKLTAPIVALFSALEKLHDDQGFTPEQLGLTRDALTALAVKHEEIDEHRVTVGGRVGKALPIVDAAQSRVREYLDRHPKEAPSGIEVWDRMLENQKRIKNVLGMSDDDWNSYSGQLRIIRKGVKLPCIARG